MADNEKQNESSNNKFMNYVNTTLRSVGVDPSKKKEEGTKVHSCRFATISIIVIIFILYLIYLIISIVKDVPTLVITREFLNEVDVPDIEICGTTQSFNILRCDLGWANKSKTTTYDNCSQYMLPGTKDYGLFGHNCLTFKANKTIMFSNPEKPAMNGLSKIGFYYFENTTAAEAHTLGVASLTIQLTPPDHDLLLNPNLAVTEADKADLDELTQQLNFIAGIANYVSLVKFGTSLYRSIPPGDSGAIFGLSPKYRDTPSIQNFINYFPFNNNITGDSAPAGTTGYFSIAAGDFTRQVTTEKRGVTFLTAIGAAGGAFGVMGGAIVFLFGDHRLGPLGRVHKLSLWLERKRTGKDHNKEEEINLDYDHLPEGDVTFDEYNRPSRLVFSDMSEKDQKLINREFEKIKHVINNYVLDV